MIKMYTPIFREEPNFEGLKDYPVMKIVDMYFWQKGYDAPSSNGNN